MARQTYDKFLTVRCTEDIIEEFRKKSEEFGGSSTVLRDLVEAFVEDRVTIRPPTRKTIFNQE